MLYKTTSAAMFTEWTFQKFVAYMYITPAPKDRVLNAGLKNAAMTMANAVKAR